MLFDTSYSDKRITRQINEAVGHPFSFLERIKMGGIGSRRMVIGDISEEYQKYLKAAHYQSHANLELRPKGLIIHFRHKLEAYSWIMPYASLAVEASDSLRLASEGKFISFAEELDEAFTRKLEARFAAYTAA